MERVADVAGPGSPGGSELTARLVNYATADTVHAAHLAVTIGRTVGRQVPELGFHVGKMALSDREVELIRRLGPAHLRADVWLPHARLPGALREPTLAAAWALARRVGAGLELGVRWQADVDPKAVGDMANGIAIDDALRRVLVIGSGTAIPSRADQLLIRGVVHARVPTVGVFASAGGDFAILNRGWHETGGADGVSYAVQAQTHASDDLSLIESLDGQAATVETAIEKAGGRPVAVSSVAMAPGGPDDAPDPRQPSLFGAGWTLGSIGALAWAGAKSVTYVGLAGADRLTCGSGGEGRGDDDHGFVQPAYHVFADLAEDPPGQLVETFTVGDLPSAVLCVASADRVRILVANLSSLTVRTSITGLRHGSAEQRVLDASSASLACLSPERFRATAAIVDVTGDTLGLELGPFALATIVQRTF